MKNKFFTSVLALAVFLPYVTGQMVADLKGSDVLHSILAGSEKSVVVGQEKKAKPTELDSALQTATATVSGASSEAMTLLDPAD